MKLSRASRCALQAVVHLAGGGGGRWLTGQHIARALGLPERYLVKALVALSSAGVLRSAAGPAGGYSLARPANQITVLEVVEAVGGPIRGESSFAAEPHDGLAERLQALCDDVAASARKVLRRVRISDLAGKS